MAEVRNVVVEAEKNSREGTSWWHMNVAYEAVFTPEEVQAGYEYQDTFSLMDRDNRRDGDPDDVLARHRAAAFGAASPRIRRSRRFVIPESDIDRRSEGEEQVVLYGRVRLENRSISGLRPSSGQSDVLGIALFQPTGA